MRVEEVVRGLAPALAREPDHVGQHVREAIARHGSVRAPLHLESRNSPPLPHRMEMRRMEPSRSKPRSAEIFSSPGQSSCFTITQDGLSMMMRRITPRAITTLRV